MTEAVKTPEPDVARKQLPDPKGWKILVAMLKSSQTIMNEEVGNICGYVLELGPEAYNDKKRFASGPWCKKGDWVIFRAYSGTRMVMYGQEFRLINDDTVEAVVEDPAGVVRA